MTDRPILFSAPMVRANRAGIKTQTRRIIKPQPKLLRGTTPFYRPHPVTDPCEWHCLHGQYINLIIKVGFAPGDRLWVRETCHAHELEIDGFVWAYSADDQIAVDDRGAPIRWTHGSRRYCPSIHMPRSISRFWLLVTDVRVQRLQDISEADAIAEGIPAEANSLTIDCDTARPTDGYRDLWESINGPGSWEANPWVVAISYEYQEGNIDQ